MEPFGMQQRDLVQMGKQGLITINSLEQQEIGDFGDTSTARMSQTRRERFATLME